MRRQHIVLIFSVIILLVITALLLKLAIWPYLWITALWASVCFFAATTASGGIQNILILTASSALALGVGEFITAEEFVSYRTRSDRQILQNDQVLGWSAVHDTVARATKEINGELVYDVKYTLNSSGFRVTKPTREQSKASDCAVFFGGSFTFGEGVNDEESFPYIVSTLSHGNFRVLNLGLSGYGPHHMLAQLESQNIKQKLGCTPTHIVHLAISHHISRVVGKAVRGGPKYVLTSSGLIERRGSLGQFRWKTGDESVFQRVFKGLTRRSNIWNFVFHREAVWTKEDLLLYSAILQRANVIAKELWPDAELHILSWIDPTHTAALSNIFVEALKRTDWVVHETGEFLPDSLENPAKYRLHERDSHPNARAHLFLARYVVGNILFKGR